MPSRYLSSCLVSSYRYQVNVPDLHYYQVRQYSLNDKYSPDYYRISIKRDTGLNVKEVPDAVAHPGYISDILHQLKKVGDVVHLSHLAGNIFLDVRKEDEDKPPVVLLSAGVGLTPLKSILNTMVADDGRQIT